MDLQNCHCYSSRDLLTTLTTEIKVRTARTSPDKTKDKDKDKAEDAVHCCDC